MLFLLKQWRRFVYAFRGFHFSLRYDRSVRLAVYGLGSLSIMLIYVMLPLTVEELLLVVVTYGLILITEIQNSALEYALDHLHPETHDNIGRSKDLAAAAVLIAGILYLIVMVTLLFVRL